MPSPSTRSQHVPPSPFRLLMPYAAQAKARGIKVYHLNIGQPDLETPAEAMQKVRETDLRILAYSPDEGNDSYREKLVNYYRRFGISVTADQIIVTTGASEAIQFVFLSCFDEGDEVIIPEPFYANYNGFAQMYGVVIRPITCRIETGFALPDIAAFESMITPRTRAIMINNPTNPTGSFYPEAVLRELAKLVKRHDLFLIADEVYSEFCYDDNPFFSILNLEDIAGQTITADSISKRFSACGARIGSVTTRNPAVLEAVSAYAKLRLSAPALGQVLAEAMLDLDESYLRSVKAIYDRRRQVVYNRLQRMPGVVSYLPGGAFYCFARFPVDSAERFCQWLLESFSHEGATVMLSPGKGFYATPGLGLDEVRIACMISAEELEGAMDCLERGLEAYPGRLN
ncbi:MAG: pyridoxal phosphate-dependent aminotransferase [Saprospiraceae bacterium]